MSVVYYDSSERLADILGFSGIRRVQQLTKEGVLVRDPNGKYNIPDNVERFFKYKFAGTADLEQEKALHEKAKRELAEILLAKTRGAIHLAMDVEQVMTGMLVNFRARLMGMPTRLAPQIVGIETIAEIAGLLEAAVMEALQELSAYDPALFGEVRNATENAGFVQEDIEVGSPAAETEGERVGGQPKTSERGELRGAGAMADKPRAVSKGNHGRGKRLADGKGSRAGKQPGGKKRDH